jgi:glycosyltransferase involved in cell wall biosynthesis
MLAKKLLSVAIPTYNTESYLPRCLDSVLLKEILDRIEIIVINDGSTDNSLSIARSYQDKYPGSVIVIDKPNGHYGSCINAALKVASGKYFRILDSDDCFDSAAFIKLIEYLESCGADMIFNNYSKDYTSGGRKIAVKYVNKKYLRQLLYLPAITYRTQVLHDTAYRQLEGISYTDVEYCFYPLAGVKSFAYIGMVLYRYTIGREGQTVNVETYYKNRDHTFRIIQRMIGYLQHQSEKPAAKRELQHYTLIRVVYFYYISILSRPRNEYDEEKMLTIDNAIKGINNTLYKAIGEQRYLIFLKPIKLWRRKNIYICNTVQFIFFRMLSKVKNLVLKRWG